MATFASNRVGVGGPSAGWHVAEFAIFQGTRSSRSNPLLWPWLSGQPTHIRPPNRVEPRPKSFLIKFNGLYPISPLAFYMSLKRIFLRTIPFLCCSPPKTDPHTHTHTHTRRHKTKWRQSTGGENRLKCNHGFELLLGHTFNPSQRSRHKMAKNGQRSERESKRLALPPLP